MENQGSDKASLCSDLCIPDSKESTVPGGWSTEFQHSQLLCRPLGWAFNTSQTAQKFRGPW